MDFLPLASTNLTSIVYSLAVAEHLGFRRAAMALGVSQSALSRRVQSLEDQLEISLFERGSGGSRLTQAGDRFLTRARATLSDIGYAAATARANERGDEGRLRLGFYTPLFSGLLPKIISNYVTIHPQITMNFQEGSRRALLTLIRERRLDIAFVIGSGPIPGCETSELWEEKVFIALPQDHKLSDHPEVNWVDLEGERFIATQAECGAEVHDHVLLNMSHTGQRPEVERLPVGRDSLLSLIAMGFGISLVGEAGAALPIPGVVFRALANPPDVIAFSAAWSADNGDPALRQFVSLAHVLAKRPRKGTSDWTGRVA